MKQTKIIPFDWEFYQTNKDKCRVITSHLEPKDVTQLTKFECESIYSLIGVLDKNTTAWRISGEFNDVLCPYNNLRLEVTENVVESWVNVYELSEGKRTTLDRFSSKEEALKWKGTTYKYICTIPLHELKEDEA